MRTLGLFRDFGDDALARLAPYFEERSVNTGDTVVSQNDRVDELFVVAEGRVESVLALPGSIERSHGDCLPGDFFGEVSLFAGRPSSDTYRAAGPCRLLVLREERLSALMEELPADAPEADVLDQHLDAGGLPPVPPRRGDRPVDDAAEHDLLDQALDVPVDDDDYPAE